MGLNHWFWFLGSVGGARYKEEHSGHLLRDKQGAVTAGGQPGATIAIGHNSHVVALIFLKVLFHSFMDGLGDMPRHIHRSEDNLWKSVLSFHHVGPRD